MKAASSRAQDTYTMVAVRLGRPTTSTERRQIDDWRRQGLRPSEMVERLMPVHHIVSEKP